MQLLLTSSKENGTTNGLNLIPGQVMPIKNAHRKIHIGWNKVEPTIENAIIPKSGFAYFVHSYACQPENKLNVIAETKYGNSFPSAIQKRNVTGVQFHPEKSQDFGLNILRNFAHASV